MTQTPWTGLGFVDCETVRLHPRRKKNSVWEVGMILRDPVTGEDTEYLYQTIPPMRTADPKALEVGHFYERTLGNTSWTLPVAVNQTEQSGVWSDERALAGTVARLLEGRTFVGINPSFDVAHLSVLLRRYGHEPGWHYTPVCAATQAVGMLRAIGAPPRMPWRTDNLLTVFGVQVPSGERHTALGDARATRDLYDAIHPDNTAQIAQRATALLAKQRAA